MRLMLAIRAFFAILFGSPIPFELLPEPKELPAPPPPPPPPPPQIIEVEKKGPSPEAIAVRALAVFQTQGRLLDFLSEEIESYADADIGAAVREIHRGCKRALNDHFKITPVRTEDEDSVIHIPEGFDPAEIRLVGNVVGKPPFNGTLKHKGWRVVEVHLPNIPEGSGQKVIVPAEVELQ
jgi:hypothetical protein